MRLTSLVSALLALSPFLHASAQAPAGTAPTAPTQPSATKATQASAPLREATQPSATSPAAGGEATQASAASSEAPEEAPPAGSEAEAQSPAGAAAAAPSPLPEPASAVAWFEGSLADALARAQAQDRPLLVDFFTAWCGSCQRLDREVFTRPELGEATRLFVAVRVDGDSDEGARFAERHHVVGFPTLLVLAPDGTEIDRIFGYAPAEELVEVLDILRRGRSPLAELVERSEQRPLDLELACRIGERYAVRGDPVAAKRYFGRLFAVRRLVDEAPRAASRGAADVSRLGGISDFGSVRRGVESDMAGLMEHIDVLLARAYFAMGKYLYLRGQKDYPAAIRILTELRRRYPDSPEAAQVPYQLAVAWHRSGRTARARTELLRLLKAEGRSAAAVNAVAWFCHREKALPEWGRELAEKALSEDPAHPGLWDTLAELRRDLGDPAGAVEAISEAVRLDPDEPYYRRQLARFTAELPPAPAASEEAAAEIASDAAAGGAHENVEDAATTKAADAADAEPAEQAEQPAAAAEAPTRTSRATP